MNGLLYHFCAERFLKSIRKNGIRFGKIPYGIPYDETRMKVKFLTGYQWLTSNPEFNQSWNENSSLSYDRTEYRITVNLPNEVRHCLLKWTEFGKDNPLYNDLSLYGDSENWYLFKGVVIPYWFSKIESKRQPIAK